MIWKGKRVLVTGAGGFIGSHLTESLVSSGAKVRAFIHYNALGSLGWLDFSPAKENIEIRSGDICDQESVRSAVKDMEIVFHLAALISIPYSYRAPRSYMKTNIEGTLNILQAAQQCGVKRLVHTSTSEVYGTARQVPIGENHPLQGQSPYAATKIGADKLVEAYHLSFQLPVVTVRPFNTFGPRQSSRAIIPTIITQCLRGNVVALGNLHPTRDLNYVANTVEGFLLAGSIPEAIGRTLNLGSGEEISIGQLAEKIADLTGKKFAIKKDDRRLRPPESEVERLVADNKLAQTVLGWKPTISREEGLKRTIQWIRENLDRYRPDNLDE